MKPIEVISHIVLSISLIASIVMGVYGMSEHGVAPLWVLLVLGGSFVLSAQLMLIVTGE
jgi:4-hydroxybenzoate polyprenyltransferase